MTARDPTRQADRIVFWTCVVVSLILYTQAIFDFGYRMGEDEAKVCARIPGKVAISSTADHCMYVRTEGLVKTKRRAI